MIKNLVTHLLFSVVLISPALNGMSGDPGDGWSWLFPSRPGSILRGLPVLENIPVVGRGVLSLVESILERQRECVVPESTASSSSSSSSSSSPRKPTDQVRPVRDAQLTDQELLQNTKYVDFESITLGYIIKNADKLKSAGGLYIRYNNSFCGYGRFVPREEIMFLIALGFPNLIALELNKDIELGDEGFAALAQTSLASRLKKFWAERVYVTPQSFTPENLSKFSNLQDLNLKRNDRLGDPAFEALAKSMLARRLIRLNIDTCNVTDKTFTRKNLNNFINLRELVVDYNYLGLAAFIALLESYLYLRLQAISTEGTMFPKSSLALLRDFYFSPKVLINLKIKRPGLRDFYVRGSDFTILAQSKLASRLAVLKFESCFIGVYALNPANLDKFINLHTLHMPNNRSLGDDGFKALATSALASFLVSLNVIGCRITGVSFTLENLDEFAKLKKLFVDHNQLGKNALQTLKNSCLRTTLESISTEGTPLPRNTLDLLADCKETVSVRIRAR